MNYSTEVKFSNDLIKNNKTTITYSGSLYRMGSESVTLVYGFGDNWDNTTEKEMIKTEDGFSVEVDLLNYDKINFCFKNSDNVWDNNNYLNYVAPLSEPEKDYSFIINENLIDEMLNQLFEIDLAASEASHVTETVTNQVDLFDEPFEIEIPEETPADIQEYIVDSVDEPTLTEDLQVAFSSNEVQELSRDDIVNFDMESLIDEILSPIIEAKVLETKTNKVAVKLDELDADRNIFNIEDEESLLDGLSGETSLVEVKDSEPGFLVSARSLNKFYMIKKRIKLAVYKFFTAIPKILEANFNSEKE